MALSTDRQRTSYPLAAYNFRVKVGGTSMSFTEVSGLSIEHDHVTYRHGLTFLEGERIGTFYFDRFINMSAKRGVILGAQPLFLHDWLKARDLRAMEVSLCDEKGSPVITWKITAAVPTSLKAPSWSATTNDAAIDSVELKVRGVSVVKL